MTLPRKVAALGSEGEVDGGADAFALIASVAVEGGFPDGSIRLRVDVWAEPGTGSGVDIHWRPSAKAMPPARSTHIRSRSRRCFGRSMTRAARMAQKSASECSVRGPAASSGALLEQRHRRDCSWLTTPFDLGDYPHLRTSGDVAEVDRSNLRLTASPL